MPTVHLYIARASSRDFPSFSESSPRPLRALRALQWHRLLLTPSALHLTRRTTPARSVTVGVTFCHCWRYLLSLLALPSASSAVYSPEASWPRRRSLHSVNNASQAYQPNTYAITAATASTRSEIQCQRCWDDTASSHLPIAQQKVSPMPNSAAFRYPNTVSASGLLCVFAWAVAAEEVWRLNVSMRA